MTARNWDRERRVRPLGRRPDESEVINLDGRALPGEGKRSVSFAAIAVLVDALEPSIRRELARTACGGVRDLAAGSGIHELIATGLTTTREAELEWMLSTSRVLTVGQQIGERAEALAAASPEYRCELEWLARTARRNTPT